MPQLLFWIFSLFIFFFGLAVGSFLNVLSFRFNTGESFGNVRSRCFSCGLSLRWFELIPLVSFIILRGRCARCKSRISMQYPAVEVATGALYFLFFRKWIADFSFSGSPLILIWWFIIGFILIFLAAYDAKHKILPDKFNYALAAIALLGGIYFQKVSLQDLLLSALPALFLFLIWLFSGGRAMGLGDAKLALGGGFFLGPFKIFEAAVFGFWAGAIYGIFLLLSGHVKTMKAEIPFGPFLILGILAAFFLPDILAPYFYIFG